MRIYLIIILVLLNACAYNPVIDTAGKSGTFNDSRSFELTNDLQHCEKLAKNNSSSFDEAYTWIHNVYLRSGLLYLTPKRESKYRSLYSICLSNRGHSVLN